MQQAQKMQRDLAKIEAELDASVYEGSSNGVSVSLNGKFEVESVSIDEELLEKDNKEMLEDLLMIAFNQASEKATADREEKQGSLTQGIKFPGM